MESSQCRQKSTMTRVPQLRTLRIPLPLSKMMRLPLPFKPPAERKSFGLIPSRQSTVKGSGMDPMEGIPLPPLEDASAAGRCRGDAPTRGFFSVDHDTKAYGRGRLFHGGLQPVEEAPEAYSCSRSCSRSLQEDPGSNERSESLQSSNPLV